MQRRERAIHNLEAGTPIAKMQAELRLAGGDTKPVVVAGQPIDIDAQACMLFTFVDLIPNLFDDDPRRASETG